MDVNECKKCVVYCLENNQSNKNNSNDNNNDDNNDDYDNNDDNDISESLEMIGLGNSRCDICHKRYGQCVCDDFKATFIFWH